MPTGSVGKALFNSRTTSNTDGQLFLSTSGKSKLLSINYPTHALWSGLSTTLRAASAKPVFREWLLGGALPTDTTSADSWTKNVLQGVRERLNNDPLGVFSPVFPRFQTEWGNGDGISVTRYLSDNYPLNQPFPGKKWYQGFQELIGALKLIPRRVGTNTSSMGLGPGNDVVLPGWLGNGKLTTGFGDDIILSSPQVHAAVMYDDNTVIKGLKADEYFADAYVYYPTAYAAKGTPFNPNGNSYSAGPGNDLIYYDAGVSEARGDDGDDILAPSFGSFNWALDSLLQGVVGRSSFDPLGKRGFEKDNLNLYSEVVDGKTARTQTMVRGDKALLAPMTIFDRPQTVKDPNGRDYGAFVYQFLYNAYTTPDRGTDGIINLSLEPLVNAGLSRDSSSSQVSIDRESVNRMGGQKLYGGPGSDLIYGIDPDFYKDFKTADNGQGRRVAFNYGADKPERQHAQIFSAVEMFGGSDPDYFVLGNPRNLEPAELGNGADYFYRISGNSDAFDRKDTLAFGSKAGPDLFDLNLTYQGQNWETIASGPGGGGSASNPDAASLAKLGFDGFKTVKDVFAGFGGKLPIFGAFAALGSFAVGIASLFKPTPKEPIQTGNKYYNDPIGNWRKKINIQDWDPSDAITIRIDPSNASKELSDIDKRWENVKFAFQPASDTGNRQALDLTYQLAKDTSATTLIRLEDWGDSASTGAWYAWDFTANKGKGGYTAINQQHLGFFGQVVFGDRHVALPEYQDQYRFTVAAGSPVFRWTDTAIPTEQLNQLRANSERIAIQLDTMTLGYYWDINYAGELATGSNIQNLRIDPEASKLWIRRNDPSTGEFVAWDSYSLAQTQSDPEAQKLARLATPLWSLNQPTAPALSVNPLESQSDLVTGLELLEQEAGSLDTLSLNSSKANRQLLSATGKWLKREALLLNDLNTVVAVDRELIAGDSEPSATVYYQAPAGSRYSLLKTNILDGESRGIYGLRANQISSEELATGLDLNGDYLLG